MTDQLRAALAERADRLNPPPLELGKVVAGGRRRRQRRRQRFVAAASALAVLGAVAAGQALRGEYTGGVWCVSDPVQGEVIVGAGPPVKTPCRFWGQAGRVRLWHHAGSTLLAFGVVHRVAAGQATPLGRHLSEVIRMSHDGRYAAWLSSPPPGPPTCRTLTLDVYEVETATEVASARLDVPDADEPPLLNLPEYFAGGCGQVQGVDDRGRVYITVGHEKPNLVLDVWMYDLLTRHWTPVTNLPEGSGRFDSLNYVTADGFAAPAEQYVVAFDRSVGLSSIEGTVDAQGRFDQQRRVPVGRGLWSPDRSQVVEQRPEGVVIRPASDLNTWRLLDLPADQFQLTHQAPRPLNLQWESPNHVLVVAMAVNDGHTVYRCDARSAACDVIDHPGELALGNNAQPQGG